MIHLSVAFRRALFENDLSYLCYADITLTNGTVINLTNDEIWQGGFEIEEAVSDDSKFAALGSTCMGSATVIFNNIDERYSSYDFTGASVVLYVAKYFADESPKRTEKIKKFTGTVDEATFGESLITLKLLDNMQLFDKPYDSTLHYPATLSSIVIDACTKCGVSLSTYDFPHKDYVVQESPDPDKTTYRDVIGWAATIAGCYAKCNRNGLLELAWFDQGTLESIKNDIDGGGFDSTTRTYYQTGDTLDGGSFNPWNDGADADQGDFDDEETLHYINQLYSQTINIDDTVITRVKISVEHESEITTTTDDGAEYTSTQNETLEYTYGTEGYTIEISGNDFIDVDQAQTVCNWLGAQLVGLTFRKATVTHKTSPSIEAGDIAVIWDRKGRQYPILVCRTTFKASGKQTTISSSETPNRNSATRYTALTKAVVDARKTATRETTLREQQLANLAQKLASHSGLYSTIVSSDEDSSVDSGSIYYFHDMPDLDDSKIIWKMTAEAWGVSTNGGKTWNGGMTVDGDTIARILTAIGVNADWINTGAISVTKNGQTVFYANIDTGEVFIQGVNDLEDDLDNAKDELNGKITLLKGTVDSLEVGGRNLLDNSNFWRAKLGNYWSTSNLTTTVTSSTTYGHYVKCVTSSTTCYIRQALSGDRGITSGQAYTLSFDAYASTSGCTICTPSSSSSNSVTLTTSWKRYSITWTPTSNSNYCYLYLKPASSGNTIYLANIKLETGDIPTDWTLSEEDITYIADHSAEAAVEAQTQEDIFNKLTNNGVTQGVYLSNNKIYINATYIATGTLVSNDTNQNFKLNLSTGEMTMKKGSIAIGSNFSVDTSGYLTATGAAIKGSLTCGSTSSYWMKMDNGYLTGGYSSTTYGTLDCTTTQSYYKNYSSSAYSATEVMRLVADGGICFSTDKLLVKDSSGNQSGSHGSVSYSTRYYKGLSCWIPVCWGWGTRDSGFYELKFVNGILVGISASSSILVMADDLDAISSLGIR